MRYAYIADNTSLSLHFHTSRFTDFCMRKIDGKSVAAKVLERVGKDVSELQAKGITPGLAVVLVGEDPASKVYVGSKVRKCEELGIYSRKISLPVETTEAELRAVIAELNADSQISGILVQSPLPGDLRKIEDDIVEDIDPQKDVDGFHPINVAKLVMGDKTGFVPCTPAGCIELLKSEGVELSGKRAVVVGRSMIVGKPLASLLLNESCTVTIAHSRTADLAAVCREADLLLVGVGVPELVKKDAVKRGAYVIDVGINRVDDPSKKKGYRLVGDVAFDDAFSEAEAITPVPGGVGPMTIAMLMQNTVKAAKLQNG